MVSPNEYEGRNVKKAIQIASRELEIEEDQLKYEVLSYGSTGIFGLVGAKKARIRVLIPKSKVSKATEAGKELKKVHDNKYSPEKSADRHSKQHKVENDPDIAEQERKTKTNIVFDKPNRSENESARLNEISPNELKTRDDSEVLGRKALQRIVDAITHDAQIESHHNGSQIEYTVIGGNTAVVIGKRGQTLEAIQYLVEKIVNKQRENRIRVNIDAGDYMLKRRQNLEQLATRVASKAKKIGRPTSMGQLNPHDRRIVHMALRSDDGVLTKSLGAGHLRKLVIYPKTNPDDETNEHSLS